MARNFDNEFTVAYGTLTFRSVHWGYCQRKQLVNKTMACPFAAVLRRLLQRRGDSRGSARYRSPVFEAPVHDLPIMTSAQAMPTRTEVVRHLSMHREEALRVPHGLNRRIRRSRSRAG
jgi:hypothetical protein